MFALLKHHSTSWGGQYNYANFQCGLAPRIYWYVFICFMNSFIKNEIDYLVVCNLDDFNWIYISITFLSGNPLCMWNSWNSLINLLQFLFFDIAQFLLKCNLENSLWIQSFCVNPQTEKEIDLISLCFIIISLIFSLVLVADSWTKHHQANHNGSKKILDSNYNLYTYFCDFTKVSKFSL